MKFTAAIAALVAFLCGPCFAAAPPNISFILLDELDPHTLVEKLMAQSLTGWKGAVVKAGCSSAWKISPLLSCFKIPLGLESRKPGQETTGCASFIHSKSGHMSLINGTAPAVPASCGVFKTRPSESPPCSPAAYHLRTR